jgi:hypothetical protein
VPVGDVVTAVRLSHFRSGGDAVELFAVAATTLRRHYRTDGVFVDAGAVRADVRACSAPVETLTEAACLVIDGNGHVVLLRAPLSGYPHLEWQASDVPAPTAGAVSLAVDPLGRLLAAVATGDGAEVLREDIDGWQPLGRVFGSWTDLVLLGGADPRLVGLDAFGLLQHTSVVDGYWPPPEAVWTDTVATSVAATASPADHGRVDVVLTGPHGAWHGFAKAGRDRRLRHWSEPEPLRAQISLPDEQPVGA